MIKTLLLSSLFLAFSLLSAGWLRAQETISLEGLDLSGENFIWYDSQIGLENTVAQTGSLSVSERKSKGSHPFFRSGIWTSGTLTYRGQTFDNVDMLYDINEDNLLIKYIGDARYAGQPLLPIQNQVASFRIHGAYFEYIPEKIELFEGTFFQIMYRSDRLQLLSKRIKNVEINADGMNAYKEYDRFYIRVDGQTHRIYRKSSIVRLFPDDKREIRTFIRKNRIQIFKSGTEPQLISLVEFCNDLIP